MKSSTRKHGAADPSSAADRSAESRPSRRLRFARIPLARCSAAAWKDGCDLIVATKDCPPSHGSHSGFHDNGHRHSPGLADFLREQGVTEVAVCGLATGYCVKFTALDATAEGFATILHLPACRGMNPTQGDVGNTISEMKMAGAITPPR